MLDTRRRRSNVSVARLVSVFFFFAYSPARALSALVEAPTQTTDKDTVHRVKICAVFFFFRQSGTHRKHIYIYKEKREKTRRLVLKKKKTPHAGCEKPSNVP